MKNIFNWCIEPFNIEVSSPIKPNLENLTYNLKISNNITNSSKSVTIEDLPQLDCLKTCFETLNNRNYEDYGCLLDFIAVQSSNESNIIESFRKSYRTTVTTDEERLGSYYIDIVRYDCCFKHSEFEGASTESSYSLIFGFPIPGYQYSSEKIEIGGLNFEQISNFVESISTFINN